MNDTRYGVIRARGSFPHLGAFESTRLSDSGQDILGTTRHIERWRHDLELLLAAGIRALRYSVPWHRIERRPGVYDFSWFDAPMRFLREHGMDPILDPLHHISFPDWLEDGFANPEFPGLYARFVRKVAARYPWVRSWTPFNEPLATTILCADRGLWYPHHTSQDQFVRMCVNVARAVCLSSAAIRKQIPSAELVHVDTCEVHRALDRQAERWGEHVNHRRFLLHDLPLGRVDRTHPLNGYLVRHGFTEDDRHWLEDHAAPFDTLGLDYYMHCELEWYTDRSTGEQHISWPCANPVGFAAIAPKYAKRFGTPILLSETNIRGTFTERITWLKFMEEQCERVAESADFRGFCWYPSIDSTDWCHCCTEATGAVDPQGIWGLDQTRWAREESELSELYALLAAGSARSADLPAYLPSPSLQRDMRGYMKLMRGWEWQRPQQLPQAA